MVCPYLEAGGSRIIVLDDWKGQISFKIVKCCIYNESVIKEISFAKGIIET